MQRTKSNSGTTCECAEAIFEGGIRNLEQGQQLEQGNPSTQVTTIGGGSPEDLTWVKLCGAGGLQESKRIPLTDFDACYVCIAGCFSSLHIAAWLKR